MTSNIMEVMNCAGEIYRNCARILLAADLLMEERGYSRYKWAHVYRDPVDDISHKEVLSLSHADVLLTGYLFHQYYSYGRMNNDIVTVCAAPWRRLNPQSYHPVCCATRFAATNTPDEVYWVGTAPIWEAPNTFDGMLHQYDIHSALWEGYSAIYEKVVVAGTNVTGFSVPLEEVTSSDILAKRLLVPLLGA
jgi:hypothetical protein